MKKIYYIPGMLSLIFLPIVFISMIPNKKAETVLRFSLVSDRSSTSGITIYNSSYILEKARGKHIIAINLDSNTALNARKMLYIEQEAMRINYSYDTSIVIKVSLSDSIRYGEFIQLLNIMTMDVIKRYALVGNDFYIFGDTLPVKALTNIQSFSCGLIPLPVTKPGLLETIELLSKDGLRIIKENALLLFSFSLLIIIPIVFSVWRQNISI